MCVGDILFTIVLWFGISIIALVMYLDITKHNQSEEIYVGHVFLAILCLPLTLVILVVYGLYKLFTIKIK